MYQTILLIVIIVILLTQNFYLFYKIEKNPSEHLKFWVNIIIVFSMMVTFVLAPPMQSDISDPSFSYIRVRRKFESKHIYYEEFLNRHESEL